MCIRDRAATSVIGIFLGQKQSMAVIPVSYTHLDVYKRQVYDNLAEIVEDEPPKKNEGVTFSEDKDYLAEYLELYRQKDVYKRQGVCRKEASRKRKGLSDD